MKKKYYCSFLLLLFISATVCGQVNSKMKEEMPFQKTLKLEGGLPMDVAISAFTKVYKLGKGNAFEAKKASKDKTEMTHQRHQQFYKGIKVEFGMLITHSFNGNVVSINGELYNATGLNLIPILNKKEGLEKAITDTHAQKYLWEDTEQSKVMDYQKPEGELVIFPIVKTGEVKLAYKYDVYAIEPISREEIFVDAHTGQILYKNPIIKHANRIISGSESKDYAKTIEVLATGNAATKYSGARSIETTLNATTAKYNLLETSRGTGNGIVTYNCQRTTTYQNTHFADNDNNWTAAEFANTNKDNGALDAHWGAEKTYDFWKNIFERNSFDDNGALIKSYVHYRKVANTSYVNAFWNGSVMTYGDGNASVNILTSIDVCGHEIGHAICSYTAGLAYQNQSGAMNEGYSDIWGACIEHYGRTGSLTGTPTNAVWQIAEDLSAGGFRSMNNPLSKGDPDTYLGTNWVETGDEGGCVPDNSQTNTNDHCGVHTNSGVLNHWFYILTAGKSGTNNSPDQDVYNVTGIGMVKSAEVTYLAERDYLTANSTYADAREATLTVAGNLYCASSPEYIAVTNAWFAVNVGEQYTAYPNDVSLKSVSKDVSVACGKTVAANIVFENAGTGPITSVNISHNIDGGTVTNATWTGSLAVCSSQSFPLTIGTLTTGTHTLNVTTTITNDGNVTNNTKSSMLVVNNSDVANTINTFENATDNLVSIDDNGNSNVMWERGTLGTKANITNTIAGSKVYATKLSGNYPDKTKSYLVSSCYDLTSVSSPKVEFDMGFDLEPNFDVLYVQTSTDGGTTWSNLGTGVSSGWYNNAGVPNATDCQNCIGGQWSGLDAAKKHYSYDLTQSSNMMLRFVMQSDDGANNDGVFIDNFVITGTLGTTENSFNSFAVYPNPSKGTVTLSLSTNSNVKVSLFDISGRNIYNKLFNNSALSFNQELKFDNLSKGVYILNVESDGKKASKKLIIE
jgi:bacillolysin